MPEVPGRTATAVATYSRRHIDLQRVAGALCPGHRTAVTRPAAPPYTSLPRTAA